MKKHSFMTCETYKPQFWTICIDGKAQTPSRICHLLYEQQDRIVELENELKAYNEVFNSE